ncbi:hypothetical protein SDC9_144639 [bioreactor metagenome]|uniref:Uncharacterized protein n=1 Tax=bioreactor metagenome TaxID=1076179 RepID=A0A645E7B0_9ZZZZ
MNRSGTERTEGEQTQRTARLLNRRGTKRAKKKLSYERKKKWSIPLCYLGRPSCNNPFRVFRFLWPSAFSFWPFFLRRTKRAKAGRPQITRRLEDTRKTKETPNSGNFITQRRKDVKKTADRLLLFSRPFLGFFVVRILASSREDLIPSSLPFSRCSGISVDPCFLGVDPLAFSL